MPVDESSQTRADSGPRSPVRPAAEIDPVAPRPWQRLLTKANLPWYLATLAVLLTLPSLRVGFEADDYFHRVHLLAHEAFPDLTGPPWDLFAFSYGDPARIHRLMDRGIAPWWTLPELRMAFCRPLSSLTHALDYRLWPDHPWLMHAHNLVWFFLFVAGAGIAFRRLLGATWVAGLAALLFALDDAHATPAGWIAGRNTLVAATFGIWCLAAHDRWRRDGWRLGGLVAPALFAGALLAAEAGVATLAYVFPYALFVERGAWGKRVRGLLPYAGLLIAWRVIWTWRGYGVYGVGAYVDPVGEPLMFLRSLLEVAPILLLGQWALPPSDLYTLYDALRPGLALVVLLGAVIVVLAIATALHFSIGKSNTARYFLTGMVLALLPVCATADFPMDRLLLFVGFGAFGLLALFLQQVRDDRRAAATGPHRPPWHTACLVLAVGLGIIHLIIAPVALIARAAAPAGPRDFTRQFYVDLPDDPGLTDRDIVVVNAPSGGLVGMFPVMRAVEGKSLPRRMRMLGPSLSALQVTRPSARSLRIVPDEGFLAWSYDHLVRSPRFPFQPGDEVILEDLTVTVESVTDDHRPLAVRFTFEQPLEDTRYLWLQWEKGGFIPYIPPAIGESQTLPRAQPGTFLSS
jgi:hypothetical protein